MSVRAIILLMVVGLCAATWWPQQGEAAQRARVLIRHASQLADDKAVQSFVRPYAIFSAANVIYSQCGDELAISQPQRDYLAKKFADTSRAYIKAYDDAFVARVNAPSPKEMVEDYRKTLADQQQAMVNRMALVIQQKGCDNKELQDILAYIDALRQREQGKATPTTTPAAAPVPPSTPPSPPTAQ